MSTALERLCLIESVAIPIAVVLSAMMMIGSWGYPRSVRTVDRYAPCCAPAKMAAYSALAALATYNARDDGRYCVDCAVDSGRLETVA